MFTAIATPIDPAPVTPDSFGSAVVVVVENDSALIVTSPAPALTVALAAIVAVVRSLMMSNDSEPATPTSPAPAPLVVVALNVCVDAIVAETVAPCAVMLAKGGTTAVF